MEMMSGFLGMLEDAVIAEAPINGSAECTVSTAKTTCLDILNQPGANGRWNLAVFCMAAWRGRGCLLWSGFMQATPLLLAYEAALTWWDGGASANKDSHSSNPDAGRACRACVRLVSACFCLCLAARFCSRTLPLPWIQDHGKGGCVFSSQYILCIATRNAAKLAPVMELAQPQNDEFS